LSLKGFVLSENNEIQFWSLRPDTQKAYKLKAEKVGKETLLISDRPVQTVKIKLSLTGWMSPFWKGFYWFNATDGQFIRFESQANITSPTPVLIEYTGKTTDSGHPPSKAN
jgi:hypothetical protein